jgi:hypothetical protein
MCVSLHKENAKQTNKEKVTAFFSIKNIQENYLYTQAGLSLERKYIDQHDL